MGRHAEVTLDWADGEYPFRLGIGELRELQEKTKRGPANLAHRLIAGDWFVDDFREVIRLGLIGGGMTPVDALRLVKVYVDERPLTESVEVALSVLQAALFRPELLSPGKAKAPEGTHPMTGDFPLEPSMEAPAPSVSDQT